MNTITIDRKINQNKKPWEFKRGDYIDGIYMDVPFSGNIESVRQNTMNSNIFEIDIKLDKIITVFSYERASLLIDIKC
jgi:hypothetical protein